MGIFFEDQNCSNKDDPVSNCGLNPVLTLLCSWDLKLLVFKILIWKDKTNCSNVQKVTRRKPTMGLLGSWNAADPSHTREAKPCLCCRILGTTKIPYSAVILQSQTTTRSMSLSRPPSLGFADSALAMEEEGPLSKSLAVIACMAMALLYVAILYTPTLVLRLPPPSSFNNYMVRRFICAIISSILSLFVSALILPVCSLFLILILFPPLHRSVQSCFTGCRSLDLIFFF